MIIGYRRHLCLFHLLADHVIIKELCYCNNSQAQDEKCEKRQKQRKLILIKLWKLEHNMVPVHQYWQSVKFR